MPFLENVTRGRGIPAERLAEVAEHYLHFGGVSPINGINRALIEQLRLQLPDLPVYFGNRNWEPYVEDTVAEMRDNGIRRAAVFTTSAWGGYSSCAQYVEDIVRARTAAGPDAPELVKILDFGVAKQPGDNRALRVAEGLGQPAGDALAPNRRGLLGQQVLARHAQLGGETGRTFAGQHHVR